MIFFVKSSSGEQFIVEIQKPKQQYFKDLSLFYASFSIQDQALTSERDFQLSAFYTVGILDFTFSEEDEYPNQYFHQIKLEEGSTNKIFYDKLTFLYLELPNFKKSEVELESHFDKWQYALKYLSSLQDRPVKLQEEIFSHLFEVATIAKFTPAERKEYENSLKIYRDLES